MSQILEALDKRHCYTMRDVIRGNALDDGESTADLQQNLMNCSFMKALKKNNHDLSTDTTAAITALTSIVLDEATPNTLGRSLVNIVDTVEHSIKIRKPRIGLAVDSAKGSKGASKGQRNDYFTLTPDKEIEASDQWDSNFIEDAEYDVASQEAASLGTAYDIKETKTILKFFENIAVAKIAGGANVTAKTAGTLTYDDIINLWDAVASTDYTPDTIVMHPNQYADLLKDSDFKDTQIFGDYLDIKQGKYGGLIMGLQILVTSLQKKQSVYVLDSKRAAFLCFRRDKILKTFQPKMDTFEAKVSSRYDIGEGRPETFARMTNA